MGRGYHESAKRVKAGMGIKLLLDTNAVIALLKGDPQIVSKTQTAEEVLISIITVIEFLSYSELSKNDKNLFLIFTERVSVLDISFNDSLLIKKITELRIKYRIKLPDAIILAQSIITKSQLITVDETLLNKFTKETL